MHSDEYDLLQRNYHDKIRAEASAHGAYKGSNKVVLRDRTKTIFERIAAESALVNHIKGCAICKSEGREP